MKPNERTLTRAQAKAAAVPRSKSPPPVARKVVKVPGLDGVIDLTVAFKCGLYCVLNLMLISTSPIRPH